MAEMYIDSFNPDTDVLLGVQFTGLCKVAITGPFSLVGESREESACLREWPYIVSAKVVLVGVVVVVVVVVGEQKTANVPLWPAKNSKISIIKIDFTNLLLLLIFQTNPVGGVVAIIVFVVVAVVIVVVTP